MMTLDVGNGELVGLIRDLKDDARVRLFAVAIHGQGDRCVTLRPDTGAMVRTNSMGVEAVQLLRKGRCIGAAKETLGRKYGYTAEDVNLVPPIHSLLLNDDTGTHICDATLAICRRLEEIICRNPSQWLKWIDLWRMTSDQVS